MKSGFAFACVPSMKYAANSLRQLVSVMAFNVVRGFQALTVAARRGPTRTRRSLYRFASIHTLRYPYLHRAGVIVHPDGRPILDAGCSPTVAERFRRLDRLLKAA